MRMWFAAAIALALISAPQLSDACAVCFSGRDENRQAFTITTALLTGLPLLMVGSVVYWLRLRFRELQERVRRDRGPIF